MKLFVFLLLLAVVSVASAQQECEVCVKVIEDVRAAMGGKKEWKNKADVEAALGKYCKKKELGVREKKICYYLEPIKRDVAQPFSLGMPADKVCKRLEKVNPEVCGVKFPVKTAGMADKDYSKLRVKQLKSILSDRGVECKGCSEKHEFIKRVKDTDHMEDL
mmetsp:Transcript_3145/g.6603  ORF Transcript_3145/g.6603 Transcript_3145/m.6603 type:complete len:162 (-) Transcript_3145:146-631(-)